MFHIRHEQLRTLEQAPQDAFDVFMVEHIGVHFPQHLMLFGEKTIRDVIQAGRERGEIWRFRTKHQLCLYIDMMIMLGAGFDSDPQLPWAAAILRDQSITHPTTRIDRVYTEAMAYLDRVVGPKEVFPVSAYRRLALSSLDKVLAPWSMSNAMAAVTALFSELWPEKLLELGDGGLASLTMAARAMATNRGITSISHVGVYATLMFMFGYSFDSDPMFPMTAAAAADQPGRAPEAGVEQVYGEAVRLINQILKVN